MANTRSHSKSPSRATRKLDEDSPKLRSKFRLPGEAKPEALLEKGLVLISVGTKYHQGEYMDSTLGLLDMYHDQLKGFNSIDVLVAGSLQRHNYWNFSELMTDEELADLFKQVPRGLTVETFADFLAAKFYKRAKEAEDKFIENYSQHFSALLPLDFSFNFIQWEQMVPIPNSKKMRTNPDANYGGYNGYHSQIVEQCKIDKGFAEAFTKTSDRILTVKQKQILAQSKRIRAANARLAHFTDKLLNEVAALCCFNFLVEECPLIFPELTDLGYTSVIYPSNLTDAFRATIDFFSPKNGFMKKMISWINIIHEELEQKVWHYSKTLSMLSTRRTWSGSPLSLAQRVDDVTRSHSAPLPKLDLLSTSVSTPESLSAGLAASNTPAPSSRKAPSKPSDAVVPVLQEHKTEETLNSLNEYLSQNAQVPIESPPTVARHSSTGAPSPSSVFRLSLSITVPTSGSDSDESPSKEDGEECEIKSYRSTDTEISPQFTPEASHVRSAPRDIPRETTTAQSKNELAVPMAAHSAPRSRASFPFYKSDSAVKEVKSDDFDETLGYERLRSSP
jgi:hypothetical protein